MARKKRDDSEAFGSDSFLDIIANMVGILIILVMVAGLRAKQAPDFGGEPSDEQTAELSALALEAANLTSETRQLDDEKLQVTMIADARRQERDSTIYLTREVARVLDEKRQTLGARQQQEFDLRKKLSERESALDRLTHDLQDATLTQDSDAVKIENYPTPISKTVVGHEAHFQLRNGRITPVPMDEAIAELRVDIQRTARKLESMPEVVETLGPFGDFRMRYTISRVMLSPTRAAIDLHFEMLPMNEPTGETIERAFEQRSEFRAAIARTNPRNTTITLWAYPDSFALYRTLKKELYKQGFAVAGRPLPMNQPIGGSPTGTKSAAE
jgi:hypothetical protein